MNRKQKQQCFKIYEDNVDAVYGYLMRQFYWMKQEDIHDLMQEVWKKLAENIDEVLTKDENAQRNWLKKVAHNEAVDFIRHGEKTVKAEEKIQQIYSRNMYTQSAEDSAIQRVLAETVLGKLSKKDKKVIFGSYLFSKSSPSIENRTNAETCKKYRAKKKLLDKMKEGGMDV